MKNTFAIGALAALTVGVATGCWNQDGGDAAHSGRAPTENTVTAANVSTLKRAWTTTVGKPMTSPVTDGVSVFAAGPDAGDSAPAGVVNSGVTAYNLADGTPRWNTMTESPYGLYRSFANLALDEAGVVVPNGSYVSHGTSTRDRATGAELSTVNGALTKVVRADASAYLLGLSVGHASAYWLVYGDKHASLPSSPLHTDPSLIGRFAVVGVGTTVEAFSLDTCIPDPIPTPTQTGLVGPGCLPNWTVDLGSTPSEVFGGQPYAPVGIDDTKVAVALATGDIKILNLGTGKTIFTADMPTAATTMPAVGPTSLYAGGPDGKVYAFPKSGCRKPICTPTWSVDTGTASRISHQPSIGADVVYAGTADGKVIALATTCATATCPPLWTGSISAATAAPVQGIAIQDGSIIATSSTGAAGSAGTIAAFRLP